MSQKIKSVLLLGSGALKIGEAGEFDYSGSQAIKALKEEGIRVVLLNPNIATVQTSADLADAVYFLPVTPFFAEKVIAKEKPDGILLGFGGQTALNCGLALDETGVFKSHRVAVLGTPIWAIRATEDRKLFTDLLSEIGLSSAKGQTVSSVGSGLSFARLLGYPVMLRAGFALGGTGSGLAADEKELRGLLERALAVTSQVIIEECLTGWKEVEYEVVRDRDDNVITVCNMENFDPVGIHTGESIVVAPSQTLNDREYFLLREASFRTIRKAGIVGECNIQFALDPKSEEVRVIEVNARLSRSSALASKATGYPLAYIAAKLSIGKTLPELKNSVTGTSAFFEPALDYLVVKMPRWDLDKFTHVTPTIGSEMKSVGEVMAIGRTFPEAIQKAARMLGDGYEGVIDRSYLPRPNQLKTLFCSLSRPDPTRIFQLVSLLYLGLDPEKINRETGIDSWYLYKLKEIAQTAKKLKMSGISKISPELLAQSKKQGFSDRQIAGFTGTSEELVRVKRLKNNIVPRVKRIDTMAGEYPARTNYLYLTYNAQAGDYEPAKTRSKAIILGCGPYAIGTSVEFDWCAVEAVKALRQKKIRAVVVNCNPETVSTDYDISDELYFEEMTLERVLDIYDIEHAPFCVSFGGQIPNSLVPGLYKNHIPILGTTPQNIRRAESRDLFGKLLDAIGVAQPEWTRVEGTDNLKKWVAKIGYPVLVRPSFVLSGRAMSVIESDEAFFGYLASLDREVLLHPLVATRFLSRAREYDFDAVAENGRVLSYVISEHIEFGGVHSGDATLMLPAEKLDPASRRELVLAAEKITTKLDVSGPVNIQFLLHEGRVYVIECNLRASRSFPFVSKTTGVNLVADAMAVMVGAKAKTHGECRPPFVAIKVPQFSFHKLRGADPVTTVEMNSTGEVVGLGENRLSAYLAGIMAVNTVYPSRKAVFVSLGGASGKMAFLASVKKLAAAGFAIYTTDGTGFYLKDNGIDTVVIGKIHEGVQPNVLSLMQKKMIDFAVVVPERAHEVKRGRLAKGASDGYLMRRLAIDMGIAVFTNTENAALFVDSVVTLKPEDLAIRTMGEYRKGV